MDYFRVLTVCICLTALISCRPVEIIPDIQPSFERDTAYFPLAEGRWWEYEVMRIAFKDDILKPFGDTSLLQLRHELDSAFMDGEGDSAYRLKHYWRSDSTQPWRLTDLWSVKRDGAEAQSLEENIRYVKLDLPIIQGKSWNGNRYNNTDTLSPAGPEWHHTYLETETPWTNNYRNWLKTALVEGLNYSNVFERRWHQERYADGVGLVNMSYIDTNHYRGYTATGVTDTGKVGIYTQTLRRYGK